MSRVGKRLDRLIEDPCPLCGRGDPATGDDEEDEVAGRLYRVLTAARERQDAARANASKVVAEADEMEKGQAAADRAHGDP